MLGSILLGIFDDSFPMICIFLTIRSGEPPRVSG